MRLVIVGSGVIGATVAWRAATAGAAVTVVDPAPGHGASWVAGGMLAPVAEAHRGEEAVTALGLESARRWPAFAAELAAAAGQDPGLTATGTLVVARDGDDLGDLGELHDVQRAAGLPAERVTSREARRLEPALGPAVRGGLWLPEDHQVDNRLLLAALDEAGRRAGVEVVLDRAVSIGATSVALASGKVIEGDAVVVATGAEVPPLLDAGTTAPLPPVRPVKGQIVRVRASATAVSPTRTVRGVDVYLIPRAHGEIAIGATSEEKGYDTTVTVGGVLDLLRAAWELCPGLAEAELVETIAGLRPGTPDNAPLLGWWGGPPAAGPLLALGHYRHGVLLAPVTADAVLGLLGLDPAGRAVADDLLAPLDPARFAGSRSSTSTPTMTAPNPTLTTTLTPGGGR